MSDQPKRPVETPQEWLRYAEADLGVAERELQTGEPAYHTICYLCQSGAEKFLKGYLIAQGWTLEKTHDVVELLGFCADFDAELGTMVVEGAVLNEYIVAGRYPGDLTFEEIGKAQKEPARSIPKSAAVFILPENDPELAAANRKLAQQARKAYDAGVLFSIG